MDTIDQQEQGEVVGLCVTFAVEVEFQDLQEIHLGLVVEEGVDDGIGEHLIEGEVVEDGGDDGL